MFMSRRIAFYSCLLAVKSSALPTNGTVRGDDRRGIEIEDDNIFAPPPSSVSAAHFESIDGNNKEEHDRSSSPTSSSSSDVSIVCEPDAIIVQNFGEDTSGIVRHCTVHTLGPIHEPIFLACDVPPSLFHYVDCEMNPEFVIIGDEEAAANGVAAIINFASGSSRGDHVVGVEILVKAMHGLDVQMAEIPVMIAAGDEHLHVSLFESDTNAFDEPDIITGPQINMQADYQAVVDYFSFAGQSNSVGHTTSWESIGGNDAYWASLMSIFNESQYIGTSQTWSQRLYDTIQLVHTTSESDTPPSVIAFLRDEAVKLQALGLLSELNQPLMFGK